MRVILAWIAIAAAAAATAAVPASASMPGEATPNMAEAENGSPEYVEEEASEEPLAYYQTLDAYAPRCKSVRIERRYKSPIGIVILRYWQTVTFCYNGVRVTSIWRNRFASVGVIPWEFRRHIGNSCNSEHCEEMAGSDSAYIMTQGKFHACWLWSWYCDTKTPGVGVEVRANGTWPWHTFA